MSDSNYDNDDAETSIVHSKFIDAVRQLDKGQRVKKPERTEPSLQVSEFHLVKSGIADKDAIAVHELAKTLRKKSSHVQISKKINTARYKTSVLEKPLEKPAAEKIKRVVGYENIQKDLGKWNGIVAQHRTATTISFPLNQPSMKFERNTNSFVKRFRLQSDLETALAALEPQKEVIEEPKEEEFPLTVEEILERRNEAAKLRAQQSYREAKARRQNKIKSKKYHRIQRKEKTKKLITEFEELQKTDPELALEKLEQLDKTRAEERMTLRHKSTGQWAKNKQIKAKYDKECRQVLAEQLAISRELTQKVKKDDDSEDEDYFEVDNNIIKSLVDKDNPWMEPVKTVSEIEEFVSSYKKYWGEKNKESESNKSQIFTVSEENNDGCVNNTNNKTELSANNLKNNEEFSPHKCGSTGISDERSVNESENDICTPNKSGNSISNFIEEKKLGQSLKTATKKSKNIIKAGTSVWDVSEVKQAVENSKNVDIDEIFDMVEDEIQCRINTKLTKLQSKQDAIKKNKNQSKKQNNSEENYVDSVDKLGLKGQRQIRPILDNPLDETNSFSNSNNVSEKQISEISIPTQDSSKKESAEIDPNKYINIKPKHLKTQLPDSMPQDMLDDSDEEDQQQIISEAFADDDVVDEFKNEKEEEIKSSQPEDINLNLPGWGSWGGMNIKKSNRKTKKFIIKAPKDTNRKDKNKEDVIINKENNPKLKSHLVSDLPYPFTSVKEFETSICTPIGRDFVPENIHKKLIEPSVKTLMGQIIEPMSEDALVNTKKLKRKLPDNKTNESFKKSKSKKRH